MSNKICKQRVFGWVTNIEGDDDGVKKDILENLIKSERIFWVYILTLKQVKCYCFEKYSCSYTFLSCISRKN